MKFTMIVSIDAMSIHIGVPVKGLAMDALFSVRDFECAASWHRRSAGRYGMWYSLHDANGARARMDVAPVVGRDLNAQLIARRHFSI